MAWQVRSHSLLIHYFLPVYGRTISHSLMLIFLLIMDVSESTMLKNELSILTIILSIHLFVDTKECFLLGLQPSPHTTHPH